VGGRGGGGEGEGGGGGGGGGGGTQQIGFGAKEFVLKILNLGTRIIGTK